MGLSFTCNIYHDLLCKKKADWRGPDNVPAAETSLCSLRCSLEELCLKDSREARGQVCTDQGTKDAPQAGSHKRACSSQQGRLSPPAATCCKDVYPGLSPAQAALNGKSLLL